LASTGLQTGERRAGSRSAGGNEHLIEAPHRGTSAVVGGSWMIKVKRRKKPRVGPVRRAGADEKTSSSFAQVFELSDFPTEVQAAARADGERSP